MADKPDRVFQVVMSLIIIAVFGGILYGFVKATSRPVGEGYSGMPILIGLVLCAGAILALSGIWRSIGADPSGARASLLRIVIGTFAVLMFVAFQPVTVSHPRLRHSVFGPWQMSELTIISALVTLTLYCLVIRAVLAAAKLEVPYWRRSLSRFPIALVSIVVWQSITGLTEDSLWRIANPSLFETSVAIIVPLAIAGITYSFGVWLLVDGPRKEEGR